MFKSGPCCGPCYRQMQVWIWGRKLDPQPSPFLCTRFSCTLKGDCSHRSLSLPFYEWANRTRAPMASPGSSEQQAQEPPKHGWLNTMLSAHAISVTHETHDHLGILTSLQGSLSCQMQPGHLPATTEAACSCILVRLWCTPSRIPGYWDGE